MLPRLPEPYAKLLAAEWNAWLAARYGDDARLKEAWQAGASPLGENLLRDPRFSSLGARTPPPAWQLEQHEGAAMEADNVRGLLAV